ncbi:hypothetical protein AVEN_10695-1 [Araneus ventricosus]|uniref:Major facilitator superfamily (MFS) profile domain-containing protein n=1 Tax=Araneus ventricosus TaxID=182803 RepID=A0A4Y2URZ1_ARAVE|nr:hypothetical protein AVEN_10695-1 [Araneus ventricosus]
MEIVKFDSKASWTVAMACAFLNFLVLIPTKVSGLFFVEILDRYQVSRNLAGYPAFTITLVRCSGGPFAGYFAERFGINEVMILGSLLAAVGISACFFAEDIAAVTVFLGLIHGVGLAFTNTFFPQIVKIHFRKHLTLAFGITQAGACLGSFFSPPLLLWIFRSYGTSGGFLIIGAIMLNCLPIVLILNILSPNKLYNKSGDSMKFKKCPERHLEMEVTATVNSPDGEDNNITNIVGGKKERYVMTTEGNADSEIRNSLEKKSVAALVPNRPTYDHTEVVPGRVDGGALNTADELTMCNLSMKEAGSEIGKDQMELVFAECGMISEVKPKNSIHEKKMKVTTDKKINEMKYDFKENSIPAKSMTNNYEKNLLHSNDCTHAETEYKLKAEINNKNILKYRVGEVQDCYPSKNSGSNTPSYTSVSNVSDSSYLVDQERTQKQITIENGEIIPTTSNALNARSLESNEPSNQDINQKEVLNFAKKPTTGTTNAKKSLRIFLDVTFWIIIITQSVYVFVLIIFWTTMIDFSRDKNIDRSKEVYLLMALPIAEIIGRLGLGWITDSEYLTRINFSILCFIVMGCSCSLMAWAQEFIFVMASIFIFGVISSGLVTVFPMVIFEFFDSGKQTMGQASKYCLFGPLSFLNGPLIGNKN